MSEEWVSLSTETKRMRSQDVPVEAFLYMNDMLDDACKKTLILELHRKLIMVMMEKAYRYGLMHSQWKDLYDVGEKKPSQWDKMTVEEILRHFDMMTQEEEDNVDNEGLAEDRAIFSLEEKLAYPED